VRGAAEKEIGLQSSSGGWRSGGGVVRAREQERGGVRGYAGALPGFYRSEERKGRRRGGGGVGAMIDDH
jgi:hypothetical protein